MGAKKNKDRFSKSINIRNRKGSHQYEFIDKFVAGMVLRGSEIKSIREGKAAISEAFCVFVEDELYIRNMQITPYSQATHFNHTLTRERKLLLNRQELDKLQSKMEEKGLAIVPVRLFINGKGLAKLEIALGKGRKLHDKRQNIKEKDQKRELKQMKLN